MSRAAARAKLSRQEELPNGVCLFQQNDTRVRYIIEAGEPLFVAKDVCDVLGLKNNHVAMRRLDTDEHTKRRFPTKGGHQLMNVVTVAGVDHLSQTSDKPVAKAMWRKIRHEVLPDIRKKGVYVADPAAFMLDMFNNPDNLARAVVSVSQRLLEVQSSFNQVVETGRELTAICKKQDKHIKALQSKIQQYQVAYEHIKDENVHLIARAEMAQRMLRTGLLINTTTIAGELNMRQASELNDLLNKRKVIKYNSGGRHWQLRARYSELEDLTVLAPYVYQKEKYGHMGEVIEPAKVHYHMYWTPLGAEVVRRVVEAYRENKCNPNIKKLVEALRDD